MTQKQTAVTAHVPTRRTTEIEEITNLYLIHPLASRLVPIFARLHVTPNAVSIVGMLFGILSAFAYYRYWDPRFAIAGFALMIAWHVMDGADGQLARYTQSYSYFGKMLDGIADHVTFLAVYAALAVTSSRRHGNWVYALAAISAVFHAIQSASYETERQEYEYLGWGKKPQEPPPRNGGARGRGGPGAVRRLLDFLDRLFFLGLSFPTAGINGKFRQTMAEALQSDPAKAVLVRQHYRETLAPQIRSWSILSANYRTLGIFLSALFKAPEYYFGFEIVGLSVVLAVLIRRLNSAHEVLRSDLHLAFSGSA
ncbi:MAG TPA: CDP-alcohol phosphatidyltransferase family protein [Steroidobacteraceae bacterium]|nr:CDP-alcohol phosphatidyltransferase family protein [Steroidobacteraceae bacterium]